MSFKAQTQHFQHFFCLLTSNSESSQVSKFFDLSTNKHHDALNSGFSLRVFDVGAKTMKLEKLSFSVYSFLDTVNTVVL